VVEENTGKEPVEMFDNRLWYKDAVFYELHVRTFYDSDGNGIGDFKGLTQKLDYLQKLGVDCIWLLPFYPSPLKDDGYDVSDFYNVHPDLGTLEDFREFTKEAHERGLRVIADMVFNHVSSDHPWFQEARNNPKSPKRDWFVWSDDDKKYADVRIIFTDTETSNWTWDPVAKQYFWHRFFSNQPDLNYDNPEVQEEMKRVVKFWLDMGLDGFRCDAVPYLFEREGTSCENLPETHAYFKEVRQMIDKEYPEKIILAEANQWAPDAIPYFGSGKGDEFHMSFNFPLMPRLFLSLAKKDRQAIVDILKQTEDIPENAQWALFLRNHDELTLEMVTEEERDVMYYEYAKHPKMKINIGIRRRLAPLVDNDRLTMELLTALLLSLPGTPVIYYGDELGMGDNLFLGDRNSVRTPMQWSSDINAGFSLEDPEHCYLPPITNPAYHYETLNIRTEEKLPYSFLNWVKMRLKVRKKTLAFGRGTIKILNPENEKIFAFIREYKDDIILCIYNLSRRPQYCELDLSEYLGRIPFEMNGEVEFPPITKNTNVYTLTGHRFFWFHLKHNPAQSGE
jgi:maltose alpha-D-glucosyltransferase / alpha-amylase